MDNVFSKKELDAILQFENEHIKCKNENKITGFTINQNWTGIGFATSITCNRCGKMKDVTDYDCW